MTGTRLQKFLAGAGVCSRRRGEDMIRQGRVQVNGRVVTLLGTTVDPETDRVIVDGREVGQDRRRIYVLLHKPAGYVTSCRHPGQPIVLDLVRLPERLFPVGRLDKDSTGLLLLTNDGRIHHRLAHPSFDHEKEYEVETDHPLPDVALERMAAGLLLEDGPTRPAQVTRLSGRRFRIVLQEGRKRQIRRMVAFLGGEVVELRRLRMAGLRLGNLPEGQWRHLTPEEERDLLRVALPADGRLSGPDHSRPDSGHSPAPTGNPFPADGVTRRDSRDRTGRRPDDQKPGSSRKPDHRGHTGRGRTGPVPPRTGRGR